MQHPHLSPDWLRDGACTLPSPDLTWSFPVSHSSFATFPLLTLFQYLLFPYLSILLLTHLFLSSNPLSFAGLPYHDLLLSIISLPLPSLSSTLAILHSSLPPLFLSSLFSILIISHRPCLLCGRLSLYIPPLSSLSLPFLILHPSSPSFSILIHLYPTILLLFLLYPHPFLSFTLPSFPSQSLSLSILQISFPSLSILIPFYPSRFLLLFLLYPDPFLRSKLHLSLHLLSLPVSIPLYTFYLSPPLIPTSSSSSFVHLYPDVYV